MHRKSKSHSKIPKTDETDNFQAKIDSNDFFSDLITGPKPFVNSISNKPLTPTQKIEQQLKEQDFKKLIQKSASKSKLATDNNVTPTPISPLVELKQKTFDYEAWSALALIKPLLKALDDLDFERPTKIQAISIPMIFSGKDVLGSSVTGSGKTAAYLLPIIQQMIRQKSSTPSIKAVIVLPTRELAIQCFEMFKHLNKYTKLSAAVVIGKIDLASQEIDLRRSPDIVFATPGRLIDLAMNSKGVYFDDISFLVFDEADKLLDLGFKSEIEEIIRLLNSTSVQTLLFSATLEKNVEKLIKLALKNPLRVEANPEFSLSNTLQQEIVKLKSFDSDEIRQAVLVYLLKRLKYKKCIVFLKRKSDCHKLYLACTLLKIVVVELHGNLIQSDRNAAVEKFTNNDCVMLATDLAARGLDFQNVDYVINLEMPSELTKYIHRIGRTARAGSLGSCITLVSDSEMVNFKKLIKKTGENVLSRKVDFAEVQKIERKMEHLGAKIRELIFQERLDKELYQAEMEVNKANNLLNHETEIYSRPKREWFISNEEKEEIVKNSKKVKWN